MYTFLQQLGIVRRPETGKDTIRPLIVANSPWMLICATEVHDLVKHSLEIEIQKIESDADYKVEEQVVRAFITRFECEEREEE